MNDMFKRFIGLFFLLVSVVFLSSCSGSDVLDEETHVSIKLSWFPTAEFAGIYAAEDMGFYGDEGLDVEIVPFDFDKSPIDAVAEGEVQIGIGGSPEIVIARSQGMNIKGIFALYQSSPDVFVSLKEDNIISPDDLNGKVIGISCESNTEVQELAFLNKFNIDYEKSCSEYDVMQLLDGSADVIGGFITNEPILFEQMGYDINKMLISDYGFDIYPTVFFADETYLINNHDVVLRFLRATKKGIEYSLENPEEALEFTLLRDDSLDRNAQMETLLVQSPLIYSGISPIGWIDSKKWAETDDMLVEQGIIEDTGDSSEEFTMIFLNELYSD